MALEMSQVGKWVPESGFPKSAKEPSAGVCICNQDARVEGGQVNPRAC